MDAITQQSTLTIDQVVAWLKTQPKGHLISDSRQIKAGDIFFAYPGDTADGRVYIADAIQKGAVAVVYDDVHFEWALGESVPHLGVAGLKPIAGFIANQYYDYPDQGMLSIAVTGTNGKTSCANWLASAFARSQHVNAMTIGTLGISIASAGGMKTLQATGYTTPDAVLLQRILAETASEKSKVLAVEASSIGLDQGRLNGLHIDVALFTNLTRDHLDYHGDMTNYEAAKRALFDWPGLKQAVINLDDATGQRFVHHVKERGLPVIGYTIEDKISGDVPVLRATNIRCHDTGTLFHVESPFGAGQVKTQLLGRFNVSNVLGILGVLLSQQVAWAQAVQILATLQPVNGRMQQIGGHDAPLIVIDYAHTPDALEKTLDTLRQVAEHRGGKLWCMFGCGGDRDNGKRAPMGQVSELADYVVLTNDNPRTESPAHIIEQIREGMQRITPQVIEDRAAAILWCVRHAETKDVVLLAGKGHESYQETAGKKVPFLDADHAALAFAARATNMGGM